MIRRLFGGLLIAVFLTSVSASCIAKVSPSDFSDVQGHWGAAAIGQMVTAGYMDGIGVDALGNRVFAPDVPATRAQTAAVLTRLFRLDYGSLRFIKQPLATDYYTDVQNDAWYAEAVVMCALNKVFETGGAFQPDQPVSRIEMARAIQRCFEAKGIQVVMIMMMPMYQDTGNLSPEDLNSVAFTTNTGIMKGENGFFRPADGLTRAEMAQVLSNSLAVIKKHVDLDESNNGQEYQVMEGQFFNVTLPENPTTGYQWDFSGDYDHKILTLLDHSFQGKQSQPSVVGQGGWSFWRFQALQPGRTTLMLSYARPWESNAPAQTYEVKIVVVSSGDDSTDTVITSGKIFEDTDTMKTDLNIPVISGLPDPDVQDDINARLEADALQFDRQVASGLEEYIRARQEEGAPVWPYEAVTTFNYGGMYGNILSLTVDYYQYTGGAHGGTERRAYNIDIDTGKDVLLKDVFQSGYDYQIEINRIIAEQIAADPQNYFTDPEMGFRSIDEAQGYYIQDGQLVIYFDQYEIAPYAAGIPEFTIPLADLQTHLIF